MIYVYENFILDEDGTFETLTENYQDIVEELVELLNRLDGMINSYEKNSNKSPRIKLSKINTEEETIYINQYREYEASWVDEAERLIDTRTENYKDIVEELIELIKMKEDIIFMHGFTKYYVENGSEHESLIDEYKRFIVDDAGTLIDIETRECYDIVEELVDLLNTQEETIIEQEIELEILKSKNRQMKKILNEKHEN